MPTAYVLINYDIGTEEKFLDKLKNVTGVMEVNEVNGVYDIVAKIASDTLDSLNETITRHIKTIDTIRSTMTANSNRIEKKSCSLNPASSGSSSTKVFIALRIINRSRVKVSKTG